MAQKEAKIPKGASYGKPAGGQEASIPKGASYGAPAASGPSMSAGEPQKQLNDTIYSQFLKENNGDDRAAHLAARDAGYDTRTYFENKQANKPNTLRNLFSSAGVPTNAEEMSDAVHSIVTPQADPNHPASAQTLEKLPILGSDFRARADLYNRANNENAGVMSDVSPDIRNVHKLASAVPFLGPAAVAAQDELDKGNYTGAVGNGINAFLSMIGLKEAVTRGPKPGEVPNDLSKVTQGMPREEAIQNLRNAINPTPADAPGLTKHLNNQLDTLVRTGQKAIPANEAFQDRFSLFPKDQYSVGVGGARSVQDVANIAGKAATADPYRAMFIDKYGDQVFSTGHIPGHAPMENIADIDKRLSDINKELIPKYLRGPDGSLQQVGALSQPQINALQAEATQLRGVLSQGLSKLTGIPAEDIWKARANYGQLNDIRDTAQWYADQAAYNANKTANGPADTHLTTLGMVNKGVNAARTPRPQKLISNTFDQYQPGTPQTPEPQARSTPLPTPPRPDFSGTQGTIPPGFRPGGKAPFSQSTNEIAQPEQPTQHGEAPFIPATEPGLLRRSAGVATSSSPLPWGPMAASAPIGEVTGRTMTVGEQFPELPGNSPMLTTGSPHQLPRSPKFVEDAIDEATRRGPGNPPPTEIVQPASHGDFLNQARQRTGAPKANPALRSIFQAAEDKADLANSANINSPQQATDFMSQAAQNLFGKATKDLSDQELKQVIPESVRLQNAARSKLQTNSPTVPLRDLGNVEF